jgi:hypothetical protein
MVDSKLQNDAKGAQAIGADQDSPVEPPLEAQIPYEFGTSTEKTLGSTFSCKRKDMPIEPR